MLGICSLNHCLYLSYGSEIRELCGVTKGVDERIDEGVLRWFGPVERIKNDRIPKGIYTVECAGIRSVGRPRKRWINTVKDILIKKSIFGCEAAGKGE